MALVAAPVVEEETQTKGLQMGCELGREKGAQMRRKIFGGGEMEEKPWWKGGSGSEIWD